MKLKKTKILIYFFLLLTVFFLSGCFDSAEIDDEVYPLFIGLDKGDENSLIMTVKYPVYTENGDEISLESDEENDDGEGISLGDRNIHSIETSSILQGIDMLGMIISRQISLKHVKGVVFSEELSKEGIRKYLSSFIKYSETRQTMRVIVSKSSAKDFIIGYSTGIGESLSKSIELMKSQAKHTGYFAQTELFQFYFNIISPYSSAFTGYAYGKINNQEDDEGQSEGDDNDDDNDDGDDDDDDVNDNDDDDDDDDNVNDDDDDDVDDDNDDDDKEGSYSESDDNQMFRPEVEFEPGEIPLKVGEQREFAGTAIFKKDKMVGTLNPDETKYFKMIRNEFKRGFLTFKDPTDSQKAIIIDARLGRPTNIDTSIDENRTLINITLEIEGDLSSIQSRVNYEELKVLESLRKKMAKNISKNVLAVLTKVQKEYEADIFGFGKKLAKHFRTIQEFEEFNWDENFKNAKITLNTNVHLRRTGLVIDSYHMDKGD